MKRPLLTTVCATLLIACAIALSACGASSSSDVRRVAGGDVVTNGVVTHRPVRGTGGAEHNDDNPATADSGRGPTSSQLNPCSLVSAREAEAILGTRLQAPEEAPLGPTCIYKPHKASKLTTLSLTSTDLTALERRVHHSTVRLGTHTLICASYGQPEGFLQLPSKRVLEIAASCDTAARFAADALARLKH